MKKVLIMALACALGQAPEARSAPSEGTPALKSTYVVTDQMAMYLASDNKLQLRFEKLNKGAVVEVLNGPRTLYRSFLDLRKGAHQTLNLAELATGCYQIRVTIGKQVTTKNLTISHLTKRTFRLS